MRRRTFPENLQALKKNNEGHGQTGSPLFNTFGHIFYPALRNIGFYRSLNV